MSKGLHASLFFLLYFHSFLLGNTISEPVPNNCLSFVFVPSNYNGSPISCADATDGTLAITVFGGEAPYTYLWNDGSTENQKTNLGPGNYAATVTDANGCSLNSSISLVAPDPLSTSINIVSNFSGYPVSCINAEDGAVEISVSGGVAPYNFLWDNNNVFPNANNLNCGIHYVTVTDANGCSVIASTNLSCPPLLDVNFSPTSNYNGFQVSCPEATDGAGVVSVAHGTPPYEYTWSNGANTSSVTNLSAGISALTVTDAVGCSIVSFWEMTAPDAMQLIPSVLSDYEGAEVSCPDAQDGEILLGVIGGKTPYMFNWDNGASTALVDNLSAGIHSVTVTDADGCSVTTQVDLDPYEIFILPEIISDYNGSPISCFQMSDGAVEVEVMAGASSPPNVDYLWNTGTTNTLLQNLSAGTYTLTVTSPFGCTATSEVQLTEPNPVSATTHISSDYNGYPVSIHGFSDGAATVTGAGGIAPYQYIWEDGNNFSQNNNLSAGVHNITITDTNGCQFSTSVQLDEPTPLDGFADVLSDYHGQDISCFGAADGAAVAYAEGAIPPYQFEWSNTGSGENIENLSAGNYIVTITDLNGATFTTEVQLTDPPPLIISFISQAASNPPNGIAEATVEGGTAPYQFIWNDPYNQTSSTVDFLAPGYYRVTVTDTNGCQEMDQVEVGQSLEIECVKENMTITPNNDGKNDFLTLSCIHPFDNEVEIYDRWGQLIFQTRNYDGTWDITKKNTPLPNGGYFYIIRVILPSGKKTLKGSLTIIR